MSDNNELITDHDYNETAVSAEPPLCHICGQLWSAHQNASVVGTIFTPRQRGGPNGF